MTYQGNQLITLGRRIKTFSHEPAGSGKVYVEFDATLWREGCQGGRNPGKNMQRKKRKKPGKSCRVFLKKGESGIGGESINCKFDPLRLESFGGSEEGEEVAQAC